MKKFVVENWYKLMIGTSLLMASFGFMVYSVSPIRAETNSNLSIENHLGYSEGEYVYFINGSFIYRIKKGNFSNAYYHPSIYVSYSRIP